MRWALLIAIAIPGLWLGMFDGRLLDRRPVERILYLGDSYTFSNDLPAMVVAVADSAASPVRYDITTHAFANATLEDHSKDGRTQALLAQGGWDRVIVQPESAYAVLEAGDAFFAHGSKLLGGTGSMRPAIVVSWAASQAEYEKLTLTRVEHHEHIERNHRGLAMRTGAELIDVAQVWEDVLAERLPFALYSDGNHPSVAGSYLAALVIYAAFSGQDPARVTHLPAGLSADHAAQLRERVARALRLRGTAG